MFGIETLTDFLITLTVIQTALIVFLIAMLLFKFKKPSNNHPATDKINNELSKKLSSLDTKVSLISKEFSQAIKENAESITKLTTSVNTGVASTAAALATANSSLDTANSSLDTANSSLASLSSYSLSSVFSSPKMTSGLFEHNAENHTVKPEFLKIDSQGPINEREDSDEQNKEKMKTNIVQNIQESSIQKEIDDNITQTTSTSQTHDKHSFSPYSLNIGAKISLRDQQHDQSASDIAPEQEKYQATQKSPDNNIESVEPATIKQEHYNNQSSTTSNDFAKIESDIDNRLDQKVDQKNLVNTADSNQSNKSGKSSERNSNPEIDKLDIEILSALKRLGGIDEAGQDDEDTEYTKPIN